MRDIDVDMVGTGELLELARRQLQAWTDDALALLPADDTRIDAHCHIGLDIDGSNISFEQLLAQLDDAGMHGAIITPLHQPDGYVRENERLRKLARESDGRLYALHRCDPRAADPARDARHGLAEGAVGLKWHPRAERFGMGDDVAMATAAVAHDAGVPVLIHAGRGMDRLGEGVVELARTHHDATFVLAHAAISDLGWIVDATHDVPNLVFDTSWWRPTDIAVLLTTCDPSRVLHGSDPPYGTPGLGVQLSARIARACGWDDHDVAQLMGGNARRIFGLEGAVPASRSGDRPPYAMPVEHEPVFRRAAELLAASIHVLLAQGDADEVFDLTCAALDVSSSHPREADARLLHGAIRVGLALLHRDDTFVDGAQEPGFMGWSVTRRIGIELLLSTLAHLATPALPIRGIDRVGWADPAPFV